MSQKAERFVPQKRAGSLKQAYRSHKWLYLMIIPGVIYLLVFHYLPMGGLVMAFQDFSPYNGDTMMGHFFTVRLWDWQFLRNFSPDRILFVY